MKQPWVCLLLVVAMTFAAAVQAEAPRVGVADTMIKLPRPVVHRDALHWGGTAKVELARGEFESAQIVVAGPEGKALHDVRVTVGPLRMKDGAEWPKSARSLWRAGYVEVYNLWAPHNDMGWQPDPLMPVDGGFDVAAGMEQPVWLRLHGEKGMTAGVYRGEVEVRAAGEAAARVPIEVTLWDFDLPAKQDFTYSVPVWGGQWEKMYPGTATPERWRKYLDLLLDYRVSPFPLNDEEMTHAFARGQREFCLMCFPADHVPSDARKKVGEIAADWAKLPWSKKATPYVLLGDEAPPKWYPNNQEEGRIMHEVAPDIRRLFTLSPENTTKGVEAYFDAMKGCGDTVILGSATCYPTAENTAKARAAGLGVWWYYVAAHYYIPDAGVDVRSVFWRHWKYRVPGQLHWGASYWGGTNIAGKGGKHWPAIPWDTKSSRSGDGYIVYPATGGKGVWPSIRLELIRDGIEDYEYFALLDRLTAKLGGGKQAAANRALLDMSDGIVKSYNKCSQKPADYRAYRRRVAKAIVATERLLGGG